MRGTVPPGASAVDELIAERRAEALREASAVNWAEVLRRYRAHGVATVGTRESVEALGITVEDFSSEDAETVAELSAPTRDRAWRKADTGIGVVLTR